MAKPRQLNSGHWRIRWKDSAGKRRSATYSTYQEAVNEQRLKEAEAALTGAGRLSVPTKRYRFKELAAYWVKHRAQLKRSGSDDISMINRHLLPVFGPLHLDEINPAHIHTFRNSRGHLRPKTVRNHLTLLQTMLRLAVDMGWIIRAPRIEKPTVRTNEAEYSYLRDDTEIRRFLNAARSEGPMVYTLYLTAIFTGMRAGELAGLKWRDVDFSQRTICVQRSYEAKTKSGALRYVPILDDLFAPLQNWRRTSFTEWVFPNQNLTMHKASSRVFQEVLHRVLERAGFARVNRRGRLKPYITFHELRHTFGSHWMMRGGDIYQLQKIMGHSTVQVTERYAHLSPNAFHKARSIFKGILATETTHDAGVSRLSRHAEKR